MVLTLMPHGAHPAASVYVIWDDGGAGGSRADDPRRGPGLEGLSELARYLAVEIYLADLL